MSNGESIKKLYVPIVLVVLFLVGVTYGVNKFLGVQDSILVGTFKYQIIANDREDIFQAAHSAALNLGYTPIEGRNLNEMLSSTKYLSYGKNNRDSLLIFQATGGWDCYEGYLTVFREKWIEPGAQDLTEMKNMIKSALQSKAIKFEENECESYS